MTLQDAHRDSPERAFSVNPVTPIDLSEIPTNPLIPSLLPPNLTPITPTETISTPGKFAGNEIIVPDNSSLTNQAQPGVSAATPMAFVNGKMAVSHTASQVNPLVGPLPFAPMPSALPTRSKRLDIKAILAICAALLLLVASVGSLIFNFVYYRPYRAHADATATAIIIPTTTARAEKTDVASYEQTQIAYQQATSTAEQNIYAQAIEGKPFLSDSLKSPSLSGWDEGVIWQNASCTFKNGGYVVYQPNSGYFLPCFAENPVFVNFALQVDLNILQGDEGGIMFRSDSNNDNGYIFNLDNYGNYELYKYTVESLTLLSGRTYDYQTDQKNRLTVIARGNTLYFYLNQHFVDSTSDGTFKKGCIGLIASDSQNTTTVAYNNLKVWLLS